MMHVHGVGHSDIGRERQNNEDAYWIDDDLGSYAVCDGMGGHANGEQAARLAIESIARSIAAQAGALEEIRGGSADGHERLVAIAEAAVHSACREVYDLACAVPEYSGMGCTLTLLMVAGGKAAMAHVGDTRLYLQRDGAVDQLSSDHTMAADFVRQAKLTPEAARTHHLSCVLTRAIGAQGTVEVESLIFEVFPDDVFLLCSDGLSSYVETMGTLAPFLMRDELDAVPRALVDFANQRGGGDNVTALVVSVRERGAEHDPEHDPERLDLSRLGARVRDDLASLRASELLGDIPLAHVLRLYAVCELHDYSTQELVLQAGDPLDGLHCVLSGALRLERQGGSSERLMPGDSLGGPALLLRGRSQSSVVADEPSRVLFLTGDQLQQLASRRPRLVLTILSRVMQNALAEFGADGGSLGLIPARKRRAWWNPLVWARADGWRA